MIKLYLSDIIKNQPIINIGTIGHVSHGKSTLVYSITGKKTQEHSSEKLRNITINLGYANTKVWYNEETEEFRTTSSSENLDEKEWKLVQHFSFVDCPGHNAFLSTMISGASAMNSVILVISGTDKIFPQKQTMEHLLVMRHNKINDMLIVQNKLDIINKEESIENMKNISTFMNCENSPFKDKVIIPASASRNMNTDNVIRWLTLQKPNNKSKELGSIVFNIIRSFDINKPSTKVEDIKGCVVGGTILSGIITVGDILEIKPGIVVKDKVHSIYAKVIEIYSEKNKLDFAITGGLIALQLDIDPWYGKNNRMVGQIMVKNNNDYDVYKKINVKYRSIKPEPSVKLVKDMEILVSSNSNTIKGKILEIKNKEATIELSTYIALKKDSIISIITKDKEDVINCDFSGKLLSGIVCESIIDKSDLEKYNSQIFHKYEIIDDLNNDFSHEFDYIELLDNIKFGNVKGKNVKYVVPDVEFKNKYSHVKNFNKCMDWIYKNYIKNDERDVLSYEEAKKHILNFISEETMTQVDETQYSLKIKGKFPYEKFIKIYENYINTYYNCSNCKNYDCYLIKMNRNIKKLCKFCNKVDT